MPEVSVIIPTYNLSGVVRNTISCVLAQTRQDLEVIVVDDGSTDDTRNVIGVINDRRLRYFYKENGGVSSARNYGLAKADGQYIAFLDHDDLWPENYLKIMIANLEKNRKFGLAYSLITVMYPDGRKVKSYKACEGKSGWVATDLFKKGFVWTSAAVIRKPVLENFCYDESLKRSYEDSDFFLRLSMKTPFLFVKDCEAIRRAHDGNLSKKVGVLPTRIQILERFYSRLGGDKVVPSRIAKRKISHAYRKVAGARFRELNRSAAITLYKNAIRYWPADLRLYPALLQAWLLSKKKDQTPNWKMPEPLAEIRSPEYYNGK